MIASLPLGGCTDQQDGFLIRRAVAWPTEEVAGVEVGGQCVADPATTATLGSGTLDVLYGNTYTVPLEIENRMLDVDPESSPNGLEDGEIVLTEMEVELDSAQAPGVIDALAAQNEALVHFTVDIQNLSLEPGDKHGFLADVIPPATGAALASALAQDPELQQGSVQINATLHLRAERAVAGGKRNTIEARDYTFPIQVCAGCLFTCAPCVIAGIACDPTAAWAGGVCGNAQDFPIFPLICAENGG